MRTSKPIATISYNTPEFLTQRLDALMKSGVIEFYAWIDHHPETDETKEHIHLFVEPAKLLQTVDLRGEFVQIGGSPDASFSHPLGVLNFHGSKWDDWFLYAIHDPAYLATKSESRVYHYAESDIHASDLDELAERIRRVNRFALSPFVGLRDYIDRGKTFGDYLTDHPPALHQVAAMRIAWNELAETFRGGRPNHPESVPPVRQDATTAEPEQLRVDPETGELDSVPLSAVPVPKTDKDKRDK